MMIENDMEVSCHGLTELLFRHLPREINGKPTEDHSLWSYEDLDEKPRKMIVTGPAEILTRHPTNEFKKSYGLKQRILRVVSG